MHVTAEEARACPVASALRASFANAYAPQSAVASVDAPTAGQAMLEELVPVWLFSNFATSASS
jgi:hypothetical protein